MRKLVFSALAILFACTAHIPQPQLNLELEIRPEPRELKAGEPLVLFYRLSNSGESLIRSCFTFKNGYHFWGSEGIFRPELEGADHPSCIETPFNIAPQQMIEWSITIPAPEIGNGEARLAGWVQVAVPNTCDSLGCDKQTISTPNVRLTIHAPTNR